MIKVIDNFFDDPYLIRKEALNSQKKDDYLTHPGDRCAVPKYIENYFLKLLQNEMNEKFSVFECGFDFIGKKYETGIPHSDTYFGSGSDKVYGKYSAIVYLNENPPPSTGIEIYDYAENNKDLFFYTENGVKLKEEFFKSKKTILDRFIWKNLIIKKKLKGLKDKVRISNKFNRLVIFDSDRIHRPQNYFGTAKIDSRCSLIMFLR